VDQNGRETRNGPNGVIDQGARGTAIICKEDRDYKVAILFGEMARVDESRRIGLRELISES